MTSLSKQIFKFYIHDGKTKNYIFRLINSEIYNNKYVNVNKFAHTIYKEIPSVFDRQKDQSILNEIKEFPSIVVGHGSLIKAEMFNDYKQFIPQTILDLLKIFNGNSQFINNQLKTKVLITFEQANITRYYLNSKENINKFLIVNKGKYLFLTYS